MPRAEVNDFSAPDQLRRREGATVEMVKIGGGEIGRCTFMPGWRWSDHIKPVVGTDSCQVEHIGYVVSGSLRIQHDDGTTAEITPGSACRIAPAHDGWVLGDEPTAVVRFQGAATFAAR